jgi:pimeloyl-ACP methyl ester carboxylesterase
MAFHPCRIVRRVVAIAAAVLSITCTGAAMTRTANELVNGQILSSDGVEIAYTASGSGGVTLVFIHGGLADRTFWVPQLKGLADRFRVVALDLGGHGESGHARTEYTIGAWAQDVCATVDALHLEHVVLIGNSLGGPVALEVARRLHGRVLGVVGVDTLHDLTQGMDAASAHARAEAFRGDFPGACREMADALFHPGTRTELRAFAERRMCAMPPEVVVSMMENFAGHDLAKAARAAGVPIRAINGDLWPTRVELNRTVVKDFAARIMKGCGHYPMLERPAEFNRILTEVVSGLEREPADPSR